VREEERRYGEEGGEGKGETVGGKNIMEERVKERSGEREVEKVILRNELLDKLTLEATTTWPAPQTHFLSRSTMQYSRNTRCSRIHVRFKMKQLKERMYWNLQVG
jgi:hypothetical protein